MISLANAVISLAETSSAHGKSINRAQAVERWNRFRKRVFGIGQLQ
jgi:hypothetical protein